MKDLIDRAKNYLSIAAPHVREREHCQIIEELNRRELKLQQRIKAIEIMRDTYKAATDRQYAQITEYEKALNRLGSLVMIECTPIEASMEEILKIEFKGRAKFALTELKRIRSMK